MCPPPPRLNRVNCNFRRGGWFGSLEIPRRWVVSKAKIFWKYLWRGGGWGVKPQNYPWGGMDIFWNNIPVMYGHSQKSEKGFTLI